MSQSQSAGKSMIGCGCFLMILGPLLFFIGIPLLALLGFGD